MSCSARLLDPSKLYSVFLTKQLKLSHVAQRAYFEHGTPTSWADGERILLGEDSIDFDLTLVSADSGVGRNRNGTADR
jgi:hypothetical protein